MDNIGEYSMEADMRKDLSHFFAAMMGVQRHLLNILKSKGPEEAAAYASYLTGLSDGDSQTSTQLALPSLTDEDEPAAFLSLFERAALSVHLPEPQWAPALTSLLTGDALAACEEAQGVGDRQLTFQDLKSAVLNRTRLGEESCRVRFRSQQGCSQALGPRTLAGELFQEASGWLKPHSRSGWEVTMCVVMEQFIDSLPELTSIWVRAVRPADLDEAVKLAEAHLLLSADTSRGKVSGETSDIVISELVHSSPERTLPSLPQRYVNPKAVGQQSLEVGRLGQKGVYVCGKCRKSFLLFKSLHRHQRIHSNHRPFLCVNCGFACRTSSGLKRHLVVHSGNKLFPCPDCGESFTYAERLVHHRTVHAALRPHHCPVCQKSFCLKKVLKKHEQTHQ